jgi:hypothetical protein
MAENIDKSPNFAENFAKKLNNWQKIQNFAEKYAKQVMAILAFYATEKITAQHDPDRPANALEVMTLDTYLDDGEWNQNTDTEKNEGISDQCLWVMNAFNADTRLDGTFIQYTISHLPDSELSATGDKPQDLINFYNYITTHGFNQNHYNFWFNSQGYGAASYIGPINGWVLSIGGSAIDSKHIFGHESAFAMAANPGNYDNGRINMDYHQDMTPYGGPADYVSSNGKTMGAATSGGGAMLPLFSTPVDYNSANPDNFPNHLNPDNAIHFIIPSGSIPIHYWVEYQEMDNAVNEGDGGNTTDGFANFFANYPNFTQTVTAMYNPDTGQNEGFTNPVAPDVLVVQNDTILVLNNATAYTPRKLPLAVDQNFAGDYYVPNETTFFIYEDSNFANNQYVLGPFTKEQLANGIDISALADGDYKIMAYNFWTNSEFGASQATDFVKATAGVAENQLAGLQVYPNPTNTLLHISAEENIRGYRLFTLDGREIISNALYPQNFAEIDMSRLPGGIYLLEIRGADNRVSRMKVVKQ